MVKVCLLFSFHKERDKGSPPLAGQKEGDVMISISISFEQLTAQQKAVVQDDSPECSGCALYIGRTPAGPHTYFWHYGASSGYVALPLRGEPGYDYESGNIFIKNREFTVEGKEVTPPFHILCHFDVRKVAGDYDCQTNSYPPRWVAERLGLEVGKQVEWLAHSWLRPGGLTGELKDAAVALTLVFPSGHREPIY